MNNIQIKLSLLNQNLKKLGKIKFIILLWLKKENIEQNGVIQ
jgi:hypothetical protein